MSFQLKELDTSKLQLGVRKSLTPDVLRENITKYGKVNCTENDGKIRVIVRYHNHVIAAYETPGELDNEVRAKISAAIIKRISGCNDEEAQKYIDALHNSQKAARAAKKK
jgi:hypothetical protein